MDKLPPTPRETRAAPRHQEPIKAPAPGAATEPGQAVAPPGNPQKEGPIIKGPAFRKQLNRPDAAAAAAMRRDEMAKKALTELKTGEN